MMNEQEFLLSVIDICTRIPDQHNPSDGHKCFYELDLSKEKFPNLVADRCLMGEWLHERNLPLPKGIVSIDKVLAEFPEYVNIAEIAKLVQVIADTPQDDSGRPPMWRQVKRTIQAAFEPELRYEHVPDTLWEPVVV